MNFKTPPYHTNVRTVEGSVNVFDMKPENVTVAHVAHSLSMQCRFNGATPHFYSVAQHSWLCAIWAYRKGSSAKEALAVLFHDAAEAYIGDTVRPLKYTLRSLLCECTCYADSTTSENIRKYLQLEDNVQSCIEQYVGIEPVWKTFNGVADDALVNIELAHFFNAPLDGMEPPVWGAHPIDRNRLEPCDFEECLPDQATRSFLNCYFLLCQEAGIEPKE